jgi:ABC-type nitrate/sulfonate/bicarbonate transport system substrate-binding protein
MFSSTEVDGLFPDVVIFHGEVLQNRPDDVHGFVQGWFRAVNDRLADPQGTNALLAAALGLTPDDAAAEGMRLLTLNDNEALFTRGDSVESLYYTGQLYVDFFITGGLMTRPTDVDTLLDPGFLK